MSLWNWCRDHWIFSLALPLLFYPEIWTLWLSFRLDPSFSKLNTEEKVAYLLYGSRSNSSDLNKEVIKLVIKFLKSTGRSNEPLIFFDKGNVKFPTAFTTEADIKRCSGKWMFLEFYNVIKITQGLGMPVGDCFVVWLQASSRWLC